MRVLLVFNPVSGSGRAARAAEGAAAELQRAGHDAELLATRPPSEPALRWLDPAMARAELAVIVGGDGAVRMAALPAHRTGTPIYHLPCGTENLFAREFGMNPRRDPLSTLLQAIEHRRIQNVDLGLANDQPFLLMASIGFDAHVVYALAAARGASISHWSYVAPIVSQLRRWRPPTLAVTVDGQRIDDGGPGFVVIANCRQYGWRLNPASKASMSDQQLDVVYFPARSRLGLIAWAVRARLGRHVNHPRLRYRIGRQVTVTSQSPQKLQLDGDPPSGESLARNGPATLSADAAKPAFHLHARLIPAAVGVLTP